MFSLARVLCWTDTNQFWVNRGCYPQLWLPFAVNLVKSWFLYLHSVMSHGNIFLTTLPPFPWLSSFFFQNPNSKTASQAASLIPSSPSVSATFFLPCFFRSFPFKRCMYFYNQEVVCHFCTSFIENSCSCLSVPLPPENLTVLNRTSSSVLLTWDPGYNSSQSHYEVMAFSFFLSQLDIFGK